MKIKSIKIQDILSIESAEIDFDDTGLVLVEGWNYDVGRANGAGKTAIFNAISFAIFDKIPRKITASEIVRRGCRTGSASCTVETNGDVWVVTRTRPKGVTFTKNGEVVDISQEEWEKNIRINYNQFLVSVYCAQHGENRFLNLNDADKKNFLLQLLDLDRFHSLKKAADDSSKLISTEIADIDAKINGFKSKIEAYRESIVDEIYLNKEIKSLEQEILILNSKIIEYQSVQKPDLSNIVKIENQIKEKELLFASVRATRSLLFSQYKKIEASKSKFNKSNSCKLCGSTIDLTAAKAHHDMEQKNITDQLMDIKKQIDDQDAILVKQNDIINMKNKVSDKRQKDTEAYNNAKKMENDIKLLVSKKMNIVENCVVKLSNNSDLNNKINALNDMVEKMLSLRAKKIKDLEFYKVLSSVYSPTGAQAYILDFIIDSFNDVVVNYVNLVWPTASYSLNSFKENAKGDITAKFSETLTIDGKVVSVGSLSGGEMKAISLCVDFAVMDVMQNNFGIKINPTILDEPFDGLDSIGKEIVIDLLEKIANDRQILVVDHGSEAKSMFSKVITVELRNKISTIKLDS